ncbi:hypothetical protein STVIR_6254 [Streptomyces viridochromogenes Tue57]|uniref:Uncharacterized protein n=1 Tax=Streptomyces viridochromogenes Tue57 TaxID=1160705 RepID=L8P9G4_STRVR|nr:hypothetical protein STVIR_6254 [Streptomyces viridochromogenes Tue57]
MPSAAGASPANRRAMPGIPFAKRAGSAGGTAPGGGPTGRSSASVQHRAAPLVADATASLGVEGHVHGLLEPVGEHGEGVVRVDGHDPPGVRLGDDQRRADRSAPWTARVRRSAAGSAAGGTPRA